MSRLETDGGTDTETTTSRTDAEGTNSSGSSLDFESGRNRSDGQGTRNGGVLESLRIVGQEIRRSSANAVAVDLLYVFTIGFFASLAIRGFWPALIAAFPVAVLLGFAWLSSRLFFLTNVLAIVVAIVATRMGLLPL